MSLLALPCLACLPSLQVYDGRAAIVGNMGRHAPHSVNNARCSSPMASLARRQSGGWHRGHWPSSPRSATHVAQLVDHASVPKLMSVMSVMSVMSGMTLGQRPGHASRHVVVPWQESLHPALVCIEWVATSNAKRKLVWIACKQVGDVHVLKPTIPHPSHT